MSVIAQCLVEAGNAAATETAIYTAPAGTRTIIDKVSSMGPVASSTLSFKIVPSGSTAGASNMLVTKTYAAGETYTFPELVGQVLNPGDFISEIATGSTTPVRRISGRSVT